MRHKTQNVAFVRTAHDTINDHVESKLVAEYY